MDFTQHPWLRIGCLIRTILETRWGGEAWPTAKAALGWAMAKRGRLRRSGLFN